MKKQIIFFLIFCLIGGIGVKEIREIKRGRERYRIEQFPPTNFENIVPADLFAGMSKSGRKVVDGVLDAIEVDRSGPSFVYLFAKKTPSKPLYWAGMNWLFFNFLYDFRLKILTFLSKCATLYT